MNASGRPSTLVNVEVLKALADPIRLDMLRRVAAAEELSWSGLEGDTDVSKPTISYHIKLLVQAELLSVRKTGRHFYYSLRKDVLDAVIGELAALSTGSSQELTTRPSES